MTTLADQWPYKSLQTAVKAEPARVHLHCTAVAHGKGWGRPIPYTAKRFAGESVTGSLPPSFRLTYYCVGPQGATQFALRLRVGPAVHEYDRLVEAMDLGYHAPSPQYDGQDRMDACHLLPDGHCYYDGSGLNADEQFAARVLTAGPERW